jgi:hypothetical protein
MANAKQPMGQLVDLQFEGHTVQFTVNVMSMMLAYPGGSLWQLAGSLKQACDVLDACHSQVVLWAPVR